MSKKKKNLDLLIIGFMLILSFFQFIYVPSSSKEETIENQSILNSSLEEDLPSVEWERNWQTNDFDHGFALCLDSSENVHVVGYSGTYNDYDFLYVKYNKEGILQDSMTWDPYPDDNEASDIIADSSDNVYISGYTDVDTGTGFEDVNYNTYVAKISNSGVREWDHIWGGSDSDDARTIALDASENVYIGGLTISYGEGVADALLIKYSNEGVFQWYKTIGGPDIEWVNSMVFDGIDSFYLTGGFRLNGADNDDLYLVKVDQNGIKQWERTWGGTEYDVGASVELDSSGNVYILGYTDYNGGTRQKTCLIKYSSEGDLLWDRALGGELFMEPGGLAIDKFDDIYITGGLFNYSNDNYYTFMLKFDSFGYQIWNISREASMDSEFLMDLKITNSGNIYATGGNSNAETHSDVYTKKLIYPDMEQKGLDGGFLVGIIIISFSTISGGAIIGIITNNQLKKRK